MECHDTVCRWIQGFGSVTASLSAGTIIVEITDREVRGMMMTVSSLGLVIGGLYTVCLGYILPWHYLSLSCALPPLALFIGCFFVPFSPSYLLLRGKRLEAYEVLRKLRGRFADVEAEIERLDAMNSQQSVGQWRNLLEPKILKSLIVVIMAFVFRGFSGSFVFIMNMSRIFLAAGVMIDPDLGAVIAGVARVIGNVIAIQLIDRFGRRLSLVASHAVNATALIVLGAYVFIGETALRDDDIYLRLV